MSNDIRIDAQARLFRVAQNVVAPGVLLALMVAAWEVAVIISEVPTFILPRPSEIIAEIFTDWWTYQEHVIFLR